MILLLLCPRPIEVVLNKTFHICSKGTQHKHRESQILCTEKHCEGGERTTINHTFLRFWRTNLNNIKPILLSVRSPSKYKLHYISASLPSDDYFHIRKYPAEDVVASKFLVGWWHNEVGPMSTASKVKSSWQVFVQKLYTLPSSPSP